MAAPKALTVTHPNIFQPDHYCPPGPNPSSRCTIQNQHGYHHSLSVLPHLFPLLASLSRFNASHTKRKTLLSAPAPALTPSSFIIATPTDRTGHDPPILSPIFFPPILPPLHSLYGCLNPGSLSSLFTHHQLLLPDPSAQPRHFLWRILEQVSLMWSLL